MVLAVGGELERRCDWTECVGENVYPSLMGVKYSNEKIKNRESDGALSFNGFQWMGGHNGQPRVGLSDGI